MVQRHARAVLALAAFASLAVPAHATDLAIIGDNAWHGFAIDSLLAAPSPESVNLGWITETGDSLHFTFIVGSGMVGLLTVLDTGFAGDTFNVSNFGASLGLTSSVPVQSFDFAAPGVDDFSLALADTSFSRGTFTLAPGSYSIGGFLAHSLLLDDAPLNATSGGVRLGIAAPVPEPETLPLLLAGLAATGAIVRRRQRALR